MILVSFEGIDGSGKTTLISLLKWRLVMEHQLYVSSFREPGGTEEGERIREILKTEPYLNPISAFLLFSAARMELQKVLERSFASDCVILDRYYDSTYAYQVAAGVPLHLVEVVTSSVVNIKPDLTVYLDIEPELALKRLKAQGDTEDNQEIDYLRAVREIYKQRIALEPKRFVVLDATQEPTILADRVTEIVLNRIKNKSPNS